MKALVVDDSLVMRRILTNALKQYGFSAVDEATNGREGIIAARKGDYNLILMDWNMPVMDGFDALKTIRKEGIKVPIVMVTTEAEKSRVIEAIKAGANNYVIKPFTPDVIKAKLDSTLKRT